MRVAILGTGLIGGSMGAGLGERGHEVVGWDPDGTHLADALERGLVGSIAATPEKAMDGADLVVLSGPPRAVLETAATLETDALVMDIAGVKGPVLAVATGRFVGTHPMAGREHRGPAHASASLFRGASWVVVPDGADAADVDTVCDVVESLGAVPIRMSAERHDAAVAAISHLPQVVAGALVHHATEESDRLELASGSFRDLTRVALSDPDTWVQVLLANASEVGPQLRELADALVATAELVESGDADAIADAMETARTERQALAPPTARVRVILQDEPGELGRVGQALAESKVDVRDLQLRHGRHGGGGVLTLSVRQGESGTLSSALEGQGFEVV